MIRLIGRIFKDGQLVGYQVSDGNGAVEMSKQEVWMLAKQNLVYSVTASGTMENPVLSGTRGFQIKNLPEIKEQNSKDISILNVNATIVRMLLDNKIDMLLMAQSSGQIKQLAREYNEHENIDLNSVGILSDSFEVVNTLDDVDITKGTIVPTMSGIQETSPIIGYKIKYNGAQPFVINRIAMTPDHSASTIVIEPGQEICLNRAEVAQLMSSPFINGKLKNAALARNSKIKESSLFDELMSHFLLLNTMLMRENNVDEHSLNFKQHVNNIVSKDELNTYFKTDTKVRKVNKDTKSTNTNVNSTKNNKASQSKSIFGMFSRN